MVQSWSQHSFKEFVLLNDSYSHKQYIVTEKINTTYTQIRKYMCGNKISFLTRPSQ